MKENSIKNEQSSIKEDIERLKLCSTNQCNICGRYEKEECMLERNRCEQHILSDYKRVLEINEVLLKENEELKFKEKSRIIGKYGDIEIHDLINRTLLNDYIPIQEVKDKTEELIKEGRHYNANKIEVLQELLEGRK